MVKYNYKVTSISSFMNMESRIIPYYSFGRESLYGILKRFRPLYEEETYEALYQYNGDYSRKETILEIIDSIFYIGAILATIDVEVKPIRKDVISRYRNVALNTKQSFNINNLLEDWVLKVNGIYVYDILRIFNERKYHKSDTLSDLTNDEKLDAVLEGLVQIFAKTVSVLMIIVSDDDVDFTLDDIDDMIESKFNNILAKAKANGRVR